MIELLLLAAGGGTIAAAGLPGRRRVVPTTTRPPKPGAAIDIVMPTISSGPGFNVHGGKIFDGNGAEFIIRGFSHTCFWGWHNKEALLEFPRTNANAVRIAFGPGAGETTPEKRERVAATLISKGIVPIVADFGGTSKRDPSFIRSIVTRWVENAAWLHRYGRYIILNIANEWGPDSTVWRDEYKSAITRLRGAGINCLLMIDSGNSGGPGQNALTVQRWGPELLQHDPLHNIVFSVHMYNQWRTEERAADVGKYKDGSPWSVALELSRMKANGLPIVVGEFSTSLNSVVKYNPKRVMQICQQLGVGWIAWSWNQNKPSNFDMVKDWQYRSEADLKEWGNLVINDPQLGLKATARRATIFT